MVLEKAFAKFMGSYSATEGGYPLFAMRTITGQLFPVMIWWLLILNNIY
jgi:hypothetical protein